MAFNEAMMLILSRELLSSYAYLVINRRLTDYMRRKTSTGLVLYPGKLPRLFLKGADNRCDFERIFWQDEIHSLLRSSKLME